MDKAELFKAITNYHKLQLYSTDNLTVKESIIIDLNQMLQNRYHYSEIDFISKIITYLDFGLPYSENASLFDNILQLFNTSYSSIQPLVNQNFLSIKATKYNLQKIIKQCFGENKNNNIYKILELINYNQDIIYNFSCQHNHFCFIINNNHYILKNITKDIEFYLLP